MAQARGDFRAALVTLDRAISIVQAGKPNRDHLQVLFVRRADLELEMRRFPEARADAERAVELAEEVAQPGTPSADLGHAYLTWGRALRGQGELDKSPAGTRVVWTPSQWTEWAVNDRRGFVMSRSAYVKAATLLAIQALERRTAELRAEIVVLWAELTSLRRVVAGLDGDGCREERNPPRSDRVRG